MKKFKRITAFVLASVMLAALSVFIRTDVAAAVSLEMTDATVIEANKISVGFTAAKVGNATAAVTVRIVDANGNPETETVTLNGTDNGYEPFRHGRRKLYCG